MSRVSNKILIIDDHLLFADGLSLVLSTLGKSIQVSIATDASSVLEDVPSLLEFDLVLIDLNMPVMNGFSFLSTVKALRLVLRVAVVSAAENKAEIERALGLGACGFIPKDTSSRDMINAVQHLLDGHLFLPKHWQEKVEWRDLTAPEDVVQRITKQQQQVLRLMRDGLQNRQIASALEISLPAVKVHVEDIFNTLHVNNRTSCIEAAREHGLI